MSASQTRFPRLRFRSDWLDWESQLTTGDNLPKLQDRLTALIRDCLFRCLPSGESTSTYPTELLASSVAKVLIEAISQKLRRYYPQDAAKDTSTLLRWHASQALSFLEQACTYLIDLWMDHLTKSDCDTLERRCESVSSL